MNALSTPALSPAVAQMRAAFEAQPAYPGALADVKRAAFERFVSQGFPTLRQEDWRYLNLSRFEARTFTSQATSDRAAAEALLVKFANAGAHCQIVFLDSRFDAALSRLPQSGISISSLAALINASPHAAAELLSPALAHADAFAALNLALTQEGVVIEVAADTQLKEPLHLIFISTTAVALMSHPRIVIRLDRHANVAVIEHHVHALEGEPFTNVVTSIELAAGSKLEHCRVQEEALGAVHVASVYATVGKDAQFVSHNFALGGAIVHLDFAIQLAGAGAETVLNGLQFAQGNQQLDTHTQVDHLVPHTRSTEDYRGIADGRGRVVFNGKVFVHAHAVKTDAQQSSRNLLLSATAEIDTKPELEIYADDVKCAHGATVGQLDQTALFYLRSRGLNLEEARAVLTLAFADAVVSRVSWPALREHLSNAVHERFKSGNPA